MDPFHQVKACWLPVVRCLRKRVAYAYAQAHGMRQRIVTPRRLAAPRAPVAA